jgi:hypothetical protein
MEKMLIINIVAEVNVLQKLIKTKTVQMKELNLYKVWEIMNKLYDTINIFLGESKYIYLLGYKSSYSQMSFKNFLEYYSFKVDNDEVIVFNDDGVPYEDYRNNDFSIFPICLLSFSAEKIKNWIEVEIDLQLEKNKREKLKQLEDKKSQIARLQKGVNNFDEKV